MSSAIPLRQILRECGLVVNNITSSAAGGIYGVGDIANPLRNRIHWSDMVPEDFPEWGIIVVNKFTDSRCTQIRHRHKHARLVFCEIYDNFFRTEDRPPQTVYIDRSCVSFDVENTVDIGPFASIGTVGIGAEWDGEGLIQYPQQGRVSIGAFVTIGPGTTVRRGSLGVTRIGTGTKIGGNCTIGHNVQIGKHCLIYGGATIAGSAEIGDRVQVGIGAVIRNKVTIGAGAVIGMGAVVTKDVREGATVKGNPAK